MVKFLLKRILLLSLLLFVGATVLFSSITGRVGPHRAAAQADGGVVAYDVDQPVPEFVAVNEDGEASARESVQVILTPARSAVISGTMDGILNKLPFESGDQFKKGDVLAEYNCQLERAKVEEIRAGLRISSRQLDAYERLKGLDAVSDIEYLSVKESKRKEEALLAQARARANLCVIKAPFDGRVKEKIASNHEAVKSGRVLMEVNSSEPLHAELLVPSVWLRWMNVGTQLNVFINESDKTYKANVIRIHGQVDPITQTAHAVAQIDGYKEELLPGMSGRATFPSQDSDQPSGFLGLSLGDE